MAETKWRKLLCRYDRLLSLYGAPAPVPCCGFGFGDCVIYELLKEKKVAPELPHCVDFVVVAYEKMMGKVRLSRALTLGSSHSKSMNIIEKQRKTRLKGLKRIKID